MIRAQKVAVSGVVATLVDVFLLFLLAEVLHVFVSVAAFLSALGGGVTNFLLNKYWAFQDRTPITVKQTGAYAAVSFINAVFVAGLVHLFAVELEQHWLLSKTIAAIIVFVAWSYPAQARFVFSSHSDSPLAAKDETAEE